MALHFIKAFLRRGCLRMALLGGAVLVSVGGLFQFLAFASGRCSGPSISTLYDPDARRGRIRTAHTTLLTC